MTCFLRLSGRLAKGRSSLVSPPVTYPSPSQSVIQGFLSFLGGISNALINQPLSFPLGVCHGPHVHLWPLLGGVPCPRVFSQQPLGEGSHPRLRPCVAGHHSAPSMPADLCCSGFSHSLSLPRTLALRPGGAGLTEIAK